MEQGLLAGKGLGMARAALRVDHGRHVIRSERFVHELMRDVLRPANVWKSLLVQHGLEQEHIHAPLAGVRRNIRLEHLLSAPRPRFNGYVHEPEVRDRLRLPILKQLEIVLRQPTNDRGLRVRHDRVDFNIGRFSSEGRRLLWRLRPEGHNR